jgi:hypothetical protein
MLSATLAFGEGQQTLTLKQAVTLAVQSSSEVALARARYGVAESGLRSKMRRSVPTCSPVPEWAIRTASR